MLQVRLLGWPVLPLWVAAAAAPPESLGLVVALRVLYDISLFRPTKTRRFCPRTKPLTEALDLGRTCNLLPYPPPPPPPLFFISLPPCCKKRAISQISMFREAVYGQGLACVDANYPAFFLSSLGHVVNGAVRTCFFRVICPIRPCAGERHVGVWSRPLPVLGG